MTLKINPDNFKNTSISQTLEKIQNNHKQELETNQKLSQNDIINTLEKDKEQEKDSKTIADYDYIIELIKNYFANKQSFNAQKAQITIKERLTNEKELVEKLKQYKDNILLNTISKQMLGSNFVDYIKNNFLCEKSQGMILQKQ